MKTKRVRDRDLTGFLLVIAWVCGVVGLFILAATDPDAVRAAVDWRDTEAWIAALALALGTRLGISAGLGVLIVVLPGAIVAMSAIRGDRS